MTLSLEEFNTQRKFACGLSDEFKDTSFLRGYLRSSDGKKESLEYVDFFSSVIESYSQLRGMADNKNSSVGYFEIVNSKGRLPVEVDSIIENLEGNRSDAPEEIISMIAQKHYNLIKGLSDSLRKILRRERNKVSIARAQQMDSQCLVWLSKQPGYTTAQKAGNKQQVLAVVRHESYDTLENRVFKSFLKLCQREGDIYLRKYSDSFPKSKRVEDVRKLVNLAASILFLPDMSEISQLKSNPHPNYVLQKNASYSVIWMLYQKLLRKYQVIEELWPYRHLIIREYLALRFDLLLYRNFDAVLKGRYWIDDIDAKNTTGFLDKSFTVNYFANQNDGFSSLFFTGKSDHMITIMKNDSSVITFPFYFIPYYEQTDGIVSYRTKENVFPIIITENNASVKVPKESIILNITKNATDKLTEKLIVLESFEKQILNKLEALL